MGPSSLHTCTSGTLNELTHSRTTPLVVTEDARSARPDGWADGQAQGQFYGARNGAHRLALIQDQAHGARRGTPQKTAVRICLIQSAFWNDSHERASKSSSPLGTIPRGQDRSRGSACLNVNASSWSGDQDGLVGPSRPSTFRPPEGRIGAISRDEGQFSRDFGAGART